MRLNHLHLHVRDLDASLRFYRDWFGLTESVRYDDLVFVTDGKGFDLALARDPAPATVPKWFHFGFRLDDREHVTELHRRMVAEGVTIAKELVEDEDLLVFRCADPDGYPIEVYWE